ncbi:MAG: DUF5011 domain-containing protein [Candidatus Falkowbacteria bacterium]|nr:DUF5011 domain-containing protein [Candidatus Falkowbacteria bacterium]
MRLSNKLILLSLAFSLIFFVNVKASRAEDIPPSDPDTTAPVITLLGDANISLNVGDAYVDAGATANDNLDGDISSKIVVTNLVNTALAGNYTVTYNVSDLAGNNATPLVRNVTVNNLTPSYKEEFIIRNGNKIIWQGEVALPESGTVSINDSLGAAHSLDSRSVLALLYSIDQTSEAFSISNLQYYDSYGTFYLKCILPNGEAELCDDWQYAVGTLSPGQSIATTTLSGNNTVGIFFGSAHRLSFSSSKIVINSNLVVKAENYSYLTNSWNALPTVSIGITLPNPTDPWNPQVITTKAVDALGEASFNINEANTYNVGIVEDYYYPSYQLIVTLPITGGEAKTTTKSFDVNKSIEFLKKNQSSDGSFAGAGLYTDWAAMAYSAAEVNDASRDSLLAYLEKSSKLSSNITDNERRAMTLLALGKNPYDFEKVNYIASIVKEFDGTQFGDKSLINDDVFALIPLLRSGYTKDDEMIKQSVAYILSKQEANGSWNNSVDMSAATIQALNELKTLSNVSLALDKVEQYLIAQQKNDGGFDSVYSTSWALQAMNKRSSSWNKNNLSPLDYLAKQQVDDGAVLVSTETLANRIWSTSYAIVAALKKTWFDILKPVLLPIVDKTTDEVVIELVAAENPKEIFVESAPGLVDELSEIAISSPIKLAVKKPAAVSNDDLLAVQAPTTSSVAPTVDNTNNDQSPLKKALPFITVAFVVIGGIFVARFWV